MHLAFEPFKDTESHMSGPPYGDRLLSPGLISYLGRKERKDHCLWPKTQEVDQVAGDIKKVPCMAEHVDQGVQSGQSDFSPNSSGFDEINSDSSCFIQLLRNVGETYQK